MRTNMNTWIYYNRILIINMLKILKHNAAGFIAQLSAMLIIVIICMQPAIINFIQELSC